MVVDKSIKPGALNTQVAELVWDAPSFSLMKPLVSEDFTVSNYRLFQVSEIGEGKAGAYRLAMANVISGLDDPQCQAIYILSGTPTGVKLYIGIASITRSTEDLSDMAKTLKASFKGNFLGAKLEDIKKGNTVVDTMMSSVKHIGLISGVPSFNEDENHAGDEDFQGIERLANSLVGETWQLVVVGEPGTDVEIRETLDQIYDFSTELSSKQKQSIQRSENSGWSDTATLGKSTSDTRGINVSDTNGSNKGATETKGNSKNSNASSSSISTGTSDSQAKTAGTSSSRTTGSSDSITTGSSDSLAKGKTGGESLSYTSERSDKRVEEVQKHISENLIPRFQQGRSKGMFRTSIYVCAKEKATYDRLTRNVLSIFQGNESTMTPLRVDKLTDSAKSFPWRIRQYVRRNTDSSRELVYSVPYQPNSRNVSGSTWLTTRELALVAGLPTKELPGIKIRKSVDFALNTATVTQSADQLLTLGLIVQHGRILEKTFVQLPKADLTKHVFVTGVTGAGKTTTCMKLLRGSGLPFMVIEPAKTEYRALHALDASIEYYVLGREDMTPFRLNPFELVSPRENLAGHISTLNATLGAVFPMEASMPYLVEEAIIKSYKEKGWDIYSGKNFLVDDPWEQGSNAWPTFGEMIFLLEGIIKSKGMGKEFEEKYLGSLVSRLTNLTLGIKGRMLNTRHSLDFDQLLDKKVVIELEELKDEQDKALFMGLILNRLAECMKHRHRSNPEFRHLTLIEEAHRLLSRSEPGDPGSKKLGVETFANLLAEVRKYGEGLIIADQIPNKLVSDVIKNTHTKIVHRLFSADDRNTIGDAMGLSDEQKDFLPLLQTGEIVMYCGGWHAPVWVKVTQDAKTDEEDIPEEKMKAKGIEQLWAQRRRLYPELSTRSEMANGELLGCFSAEGVELINMMLSIKSVFVTSGWVKAIGYISRVQPRYAKKYQALSERTGLDSTVLAQLLTALFFDASGFDCTEKTESLFMKVLPSVFENLFFSADMFKECAETIEGKRFFGDVLFKKLESI